MWCVLTRFILGKVIRLEPSKVGVHIQNLDLYLLTYLFHNVLSYSYVYLYDGLNMWLTVLCEKRVLIPNEHGEKLVGLLHQTSSKKLVILCHGFRATKASPYNPRKLLHLSTLYIEFGTMFRVFSPLLLLLSYNIPQEQNSLIWYLILFGTNFLCMHFMRVLSEVTNRSIYPAI